VVADLSHPATRLWRGCADFLDHYGTDACVDVLRLAALHDPLLMYGEAIWPRLAAARPRAVSALKHMLREETNPGLLRRAHQALTYQEPAYHEAMNLYTRLRGTERAKAFRSACSPERRKRLGPVAVCVGDTAPAGMATA